MSGDVLSRPGNVLVVDDHESVRVFLEEALRKHGFDALGVETGQAGIEATDATVDAVLLDLGLPDMNGLDVLDAIRALPHPPPVIVLTGSVDRDAPACLSRGAHDFMSKPPQLEELIARVSAAVRVKHLQDELHEANRLLTHQALTDALTGLANRRQGEQELAQLVVRSSRHGHPLGLVLVDLDGFKAINDTHGHTAGDHALREVALRMAGCLRGSDTLARWGGEEFVVLLPDTESSGVGLTAERLRRAVAAEPFHVEGAVIELTVSVGWADWRGEDPGEFMLRADRALYEAKTAGRNAVRPQPAPAV